MSQSADHTLSGLIDKIADQAVAANGISIGAIQSAAGKRMAGPLLFFPAMVVVSPLSVIPTIPTMVACVIILVAGQLALGRQVIWLPRRVLDMSLSLERLQKVLDVLRPAVGWLERLSRPRLTMLVEGPGIRAAALVCILVALTMPPLEFLPGASTWAGVTIATFGLSLTMKDGLLLLLSLMAVIATATLFTQLVF